MAIVGNVLILVALQSDSHLFPTSRMLFRSLASTDLCVGLISQPCFGIFLFSVITNRMRICQITEGILHASSAVLCGISLSNLTAISVDRLLALQLGLRYRQVVTVPRVRGVIALSWLVYTSLGLLYYLNVDIYLIVLPINTLLCIIPLTVCYMKIVVTIRLRQARIYERAQLNNVNPGRLQMYQKTVTYSMWVSLAIIFFYLPFVVVIVFLLCVQKASRHVWFSLTHRWTHLFIAGRSRKWDKLWRWRSDAVGLSPRRNNVWHSYWESATSLSLTLSNGSYVFLSTESFMCTLLS